MSSTNWDDVAAGTTTAVDDTFILSGSKRIRLDDLFKTIPSEVIVKTATGIDCNPGSDVDTDLITVGVTGSPKLWWDESESAVTITTRLNIGTVATTWSDDPMVNVNRNWDGSTGNGHCFSDSTTITRTGTVSYNSYDARILISGTASYGHYASFQATPNANTSGTVGVLYGFVNVPTVSDGIVATSYGVYCGNPTLAGDAVLTDNYGVYIPALTSGTSSNFAIYTAGAAGTVNTPSAFWGHIGIGGLSDPGAVLAIGSTNALATKYGVQVYSTNNATLVHYDAVGGTTGGGTVSLLFGMYDRADQGATGCTLRASVYSSAPSSAGTTVTRAGLYVVDSVGTVTTQYGVYIGSLTNAGTDWAIYTAGTTPSSFGGMVTVGGLTVADATNIVLNTTTGTQIGTSATQKLGFFGITPIIQPTVATGATVATLITQLTLLGLIKNV